MCDLRLIRANQIALRGFFIALWQPSLSHSFLMSRTFHGIKFKIKKQTSPRVRICLLLAEKERFELSLRLSRTTPLAGEPLRPLGYFSKPNLKLLAYDSTLPNKSQCNLGSFLRKNYFFTHKTQGRGLGAAPFWVGRPQKPRVRARVNICFCEEVFLWFFLFL